jgi:hypothetical protein
MPIATKNHTLVKAITKVVTTCTTSTQITAALTLKMGRMRISTYLGAAKTTPLYLLPRLMRSMDMSSSETHF